MKQYFLEKDLQRQFRTHSLITGVLLLIAGMVSILLPELTSLTISFILGWLLFIGGIASAYHVVKSYTLKWIAWLKPFLLISMGLLIFFRPLTGVAAITLILVIYFLFDAFAGITFGMELRPLRGWGWMLFNGLASLLIAIIFLVGWPISSLWLIGLLVGISLVFDGIALIMLGTSIHKNTFE